MTNKKTKQFNREQIQHCLTIIDQLKPSGLSTLEFAKTQGLTYGQIRAWQLLMLAQLELRRMLSPRFLRQSASF